MQHSSASENPKSALRKAALTQRGLLPIDTISQAIRQAIQNWPGFTQAEHILFYAPFRSEVDLLPLAQSFPEKRWYLPLIASGGKMMFYLYDPDSPLEPGKYGIATPQPNGAPFHPGSAFTLILVPGVLFDRQGHRLGYGKGYYDRFLSHPEINTPQCQRIGIVPEALVMDALPHDAWDIPMHALATENGLWFIP